MENIVDLPKSVLMMKVRKVKEQKSFPLFVDAMKYAVEKGLNSQPLVSVLNCIEFDKVKPAEVKRNLYSLINHYMRSCYAFSKRQDLWKKPSEAQRVEWEYSLNADDSDYFQKLSAHLLLYDTFKHEEYHEKLTRADNKYGWFTPAWEIEHILSTFDDNDNPAIIIADYLKDLYPAQPTNSFEVKPISESYATLLEDLYAIIGINCDFYSVEKICIDYCLSGELIIGVDELLECLKEVSGELVDAVIFAWFLDDELPPNENRLGENLLQLCIDTPDLDEYSFLENWLHNIDNCDSELETRGNIFEEFIKNYKLYRHSNCSGKSLYDAETAFNVYFALKYRISSHTALEDIDLTTRLTQCMMSEHGDSCFLHLFDPSDQVENKIWSVTGRQNEYLECHALIKSEKMHELAAAWLSFFIISQAYANKGVLGNWLDICSVIERELGHTYSKILVPAIEYARNQALKHGNYLDSKRFSALISSSSPGQVIKNDSFFDDLPSRNESVIKEKLKDEYGELLERLHPKPFDHLVTAKLSWGIMQSYMRLGVIQWGTFVAHFTLVIEAELKDRLLEIYLSENYEAYRKPPWNKNPTFGSFIKMLKDSDRLPDDLRAQLDRTIKVGNDPKQAEDLSLALKIRNQGFHPTVYGFAQAQRDIKTLIDDGLLKRFLQSLVHLD